MLLKIMIINRLLFVWFLQVCIQIIKRPKDPPWTKFKYWLDFGAFPI